MNFLRYTKKTGIKNSHVVDEIWLDFNQSRTEGDLIAFYEKKFQTNIGIISHDSFFNIFERKKKGAHKYLSFERKPESFENLMLLAKSETDLFYLRYEFEEILPFLNENDCVINLPLTQIFERFGRTNVTQITEETCDELEEDLKVG